MPEIENEEVQQNDNEETSQEKKPEDVFYPEESDSEEGGKKGGEVEPEAEDEEEDAGDEDSEENEEESDDEESDDDSEDDSEEGDKGEKKGKTDASKFKLEAPEDSKITDEQIEEIREFAKEHGLSEKQAQALLNREGEAQINQRDFLAKKSVEWFKTAKKDKEIFGGSKEAFAENAEIAKRVLEGYATPDFRQQLKESRLGDHPEFLRLLMRVGKEMGVTPKALVRGGNVAKAPVPVEDLFYPTTESKQE